MQSEVEDHSPGKGTPDLPVPKPLSYGVEIEGLVHYIIEDEKDPLGHIEGLPEPIRVPDSSDPDIDDGFIIDYVGDHCREMMLKTLKDHNFPVEGMKITCGKPRSTEDYVAHERIKDASNWVIKTDSSVHGPDNTECKFIDFELNTSVESDSPESLKVLQFALNCLLQRYRLLVNDSCGLHVHVGNEAAMFSLNNLKRISALCWSAENLVHTIHPTWRQLNNFCIPLRTASKLGRGVKNPFLAHNDSHNPQTSRYTGGDVRFGERDTLWRETHSHDDTVRSYLKSRELKNDFAPWLDDEAPFDIQENSAKYKAFADRFEGPKQDKPPIPSYAFTIPDELSGSSPVSSAPSSRPDSPETSRNGDQESLEPQVMLTQQQLASRVAPLPKDRNFKPLATRRFTTRPRCMGSEVTDEDTEKWRQMLTHGENYVDMTMRKPAHLLDGVVRLLEAETSCEIAALLVTDRLYSKTNYYFGMYDCAVGNLLERHTVEFRQAESSLDPAWVTTWVKICIGMIKFAINAPADVFMQVVTNCDLAERDRGSYDVVDLLGDMGLFAEANAVAERMWQNREEWCLVYNDDEGNPDDEGGGSDEDHPSNPGNSGGGDGGGSGG
ncbi:uncharacterized protein PG998_002580 [Apiospora kogelbergensis]